MSRKQLAALLVASLMASAANAAFLVQVDTDGADDGPFTPSPNFSFGGDTTTASSSSLSGAPLLPVGDSLFGGDGINEPDTYVYRYDPTSDADNLATGGAFLGVDLAGDPVYGSGQTGGAPGLYRVLAAWPGTENVNAAGVTYEAVSGSNSFSVLVDQNTANDATGGFDDVWVLLGVIEYDGSSGIIVSQKAEVNSFVSMRAAAVLFEPIPEPSTTVLALAALAGLAARSRRFAG